MKILSRVAVAFNVFNWFKMRQFEGDFPFSHSGCGITAICILAKIHFTKSSVWESPLLWCKMHLSRQSFDLFTVNISELGRSNASVIILNKKFIMDNSLISRSKWAWFCPLVLTFALLCLENSRIFDQRLYCFVSGSSLKTWKLHHHSLVIFKRW
jgi:hypothetical protein